VPTRWLSLGNSVKRILEEWKSLTEFYNLKDIKEKKNAFTSKLFLCPKTKTYIQVISYFLEKFNITNKIFQDESITSYSLFSLLREFFTSLSKIILKPDFRKRKDLSFGNLYKINLIDDEEISSYFMDSHGCLDSFKKERFRTEVEWSLISEEEQLKLAESIREFVLETLHQMKNYLPLQDEYINLFKVFNPVDFDREDWISLVDKFPNIITPEIFSKFIEELDKLEVYNFDKCESLHSMYAKWDKINMDINIPIICSFAKTLLSIPVSSASIERVFSQMRIIKNPLRTKLRDDTLEACLLLQK